MPRLSGDPFAVLDRRLRRFANAERSARIDAAKEATQVTSTKAKALRPRAPMRRGRPGTPRLGATLRWEAGSGNDTMVRFNTAEADSKVPHWIIQEIGTAESATIKQGAAEDDYDSRNPIGRPKKGSTYARTVRPQIGRRISSSLAWGTGPKGKWTPPGAARNEQLYFARNLSGAPFRRASIVISREITGKRMVHEGGNTGYLQYEKSLLEAARRAFMGYPRP